MNTACTITIRTIREKHEKQNEEFKFIYRLSDGIEKKKQKYVALCLGRSCAVQILIIDPFGSGCILMAI